ncbi:hypothetical protein ABG79_02365 [Caloramator mitchellensis]|uniref:Uncharacterized protein n=1 Tax=Caloramator mitchellensis TaxID=908809 RepID=A0A0R3JQV9_CALMK|nr:hypothetical protein ABG79_02365 [Caloramator mitchellensis]
MIFVTRGISKNVFSNKDKKMHLFEGAARKI